MQHAASFAEYNRDYVGITIWDSLDSDFDK